MKESLLNWKFVFSLLLTVGILQAATADPVARVRIDGMVCYFCTSGIEKQARKNNIGKTFETNLDKGIVTITLDPMQPVPSPSEFRGIVDHAGFTYHGVNLDVSGRLKTAGKKFSLETAVGIPPVFFDAGKLENDLKPLLDKMVTLTLAAGPNGPDDWQAVKQPGSGLTK